MNNPPFYRLPQDVFYIIFLSLPLRQIVACRTVSKPFHQLLTSRPFLSLLNSLSPHSIVFLRHYFSSTKPFLLTYDMSTNLWHQFDLSYIPFSALYLVTSTLGLVFLLARSSNSPQSSTSLLVCNPLTRSYRVLPKLRSASSRHGFVISASENRVVVITELTIYHSNVLGSTTESWMRFSSNLPSQPRSPVIVGDSLYTLCALRLGTSTRRVWKLFTCEFPDPEVKTAALGWTLVKSDEWGDVFGILEQPTLVKGVGKKVLVVGSLKSTFSLNTASSRILICRLDLESLKWDEAGRMPVDMWKRFHEYGEFKVFGGGDKVCFSAKRSRKKLVLWDCGEWRWINGDSVFGGNLYRGCLFDSRHDAISYSTSETGFAKGR